ncbi:MAG: RNA polymerase sigma factor [Gemmatimonadales bacterium]
MEPELALEAQDLQQLHERAVADLPEARRRAYLLVREQHVSHADAAALLRVTPSAVNASVVRAQRALREELERHGIRTPRETRRQKPRVLVSRRQPTRRRRSTVDSRV